MFIYIHIYSTYTYINIYIQRNILINKCVFNTIFSSNTLFMALKLIYIYIYIYIYVSEPLYMHSYLYTHACLYRLRISQLLLSLLIKARVLQFGTEKTIWLKAIDNLVTTQHILTLRSLIKYLYLTLLKNVTEFLRDCAIKNLSQKKS